MKEFSSKQRLPLYIASWLKRSIITKTAIQSEDRNEAFCTYARPVVILCNLS